MKICRTGSFSSQNVSLITYIRLDNHCLKVVFVYVQIIGLLRNVLQGKRGAICYLDEWPEFSTVLVKPTNPYLPEDALYVFSTAGDKAKTFLYENCQLLDDFLPYGFISISQVSVLTIIKEIYRDRPVSVDVFGPHVLMEAVPGSSEHDNALNVPVGLTVSRLTSKDVSTIVGSGSYSQTSTTYIDHIVNNYTNVALRQGDGTLVGWNAERPHGALGMLFVDEKMRGQGLAKYLVKALRNEMFRQGKPAYSFVAADNLRSINLHNNCGFRMHSMDKYNCLIVLKAKQ